MARKRTALASWLMSWLSFMAKALMLMGLKKRVGGLLALFPIIRKTSLVANPCGEAENW